MAYAVAAFAVAGAALISFAAVQASRSEQRVFVLDAAGTLHIGPLQPLAHSESFFRTAALLAAQTALARSPAGFDGEELLPQLFLPRARAVLELDRAAAVEASRAKHEQQKALVHSITAPVPRGSFRLVEVRGRLVRAGVFAGRAFYEEPAFRLALEFGPNPHAGDAAYPWVVHACTLEVTEPPSSAAP